jgi:hypothetical protein
MAPNLARAIFAAPPPWAPSRLLPNTNTSFAFKSDIKSGDTRLSIEIHSFILDSLFKIQTLLVNTVAGKIFTSNHWYYLKPEQ